MLKGISTTPKPCLSRVSIEKATQPKFKQSGYVDLYTDQETDITLDTTHKIKLTFDFNIKIKYPYSNSGEYSSFFKHIKTILDTLLLNARVFTNKEEFKQVIFQHLYLLSPE